MEGEPVMGKVIEMPLPARETSSPVCTARIMPGMQLRSLDPREWDDLAESEIEENPFLARQFVLAGLDALGDANGMQVVELRTGGVLTGLIPFKPRAACGVLPVRQGQIALNLYQVHGAPLIRKEGADETLMAFLDCPGLPLHWAFPHVDFNGPFASAVTRVAARRGLRAVQTRRYMRPVLTRMDEGLESFMRNVVGPKRGKDIARRLRRLREIGDVRFERATAPEHVARRVEDFLHMENAGWKGERRTSLLAREDDARFARLAFTGENGFTSVDSLLLDGTPIAAVVNISTGPSLFTAKCAFDEKYRKFAPGLILEYLAIEHFYAGETYEEMDAATSVDGHMLLGFWNSAKPMGTLILGPHGPETTLIARLEDVKYTGWNTLKRILRRS
jgi:hypothetical protein